MTTTITPEALIKRLEEANDHVIGEAKHHRAVSDAIDFIRTASELLAAQPASSAGGQEPARFSCTGYNCSDLNDGGGPIMAPDPNGEWVRYAPVAGEAAQHNVHACIDLTACQLREALLMAGDPEFDTDFDDRPRVRIFYMEKGHSGPGLYCECVDAEEEGCILLDGTSPAIRQDATPAPAAVPVDATNFAQLYGMVCEAIDNAGFHISMDPINFLINLTPKNPQPAAQGVDLGQFRARVAELLRGELDLEVADPEDPQHDDGSGEADRVAGKIAAIAALASQPQAPAAVVPDGFVLVPTDPTPPMRAAGNKAIQNCNTELGMGIADRAFYCYSAMLAAAPAPEVDRG